MSDNPETLRTTAPKGPRPTVGRPGLGGGGAPVSPPGARVTPNGPPPDVVLILRQDGTITFASRSLAGVPADELAGTTLYEYVAEEQQDALRECLLSIFAGAATAECEIRGLSPGAADAWFECRLAASRSGDETHACNVVIRDITARRTREELMRSELETLRASGPIAASAGEETDADPLARFLSAVQEAGEAMFVTDETTGCVVDANTTACRWLRMRRNELLGRPARELEVEFPLIFPPESDGTLTDTRIAERPLVFNHARHRRRDRSAFPVEVSLTRHRIEERTYVLAVVREVREREKDQQRIADLERVYGSLVEATRDAVLLTARDGRIESANPAAVALLGYDWATLLARRLQQLYVDPKDVERFREAVREHGEVRALELGLKRADGTTLPVRLSASPRRNPAGDIRGYQCLVQDKAAEPRVSARVSMPTHMALGRAIAARPSSPAGAKQAVVGKTMVLVLEADDHERSESRIALEAAGLGVVEAANLGEALRAARDTEQELNAAVLDGQQAAADGCALLEALERYRPGLPVLIIDREGATVAVDARFTAVRGRVRRPAHPLALLQRVREVLGQG